jgi:hypothetical protein
MKLPLFLRRRRLSNDEIDKAMDDLRRLRVEVAVEELELLLRRSNVRVLRPKEMNGSRTLPRK